MCAHFWYCLCEWGVLGRKRYGCVETIPVIWDKCNEITNTPITEEWVVVLINRHRKHVPAPQWSEMHRTPQDLELRGFTETVALASFHTSVSLAKSSNKAIDFFFDSKQFFWLNREENCYSNKKLPCRISDSFQKCVSTGLPIKQILQISASCQTLYRSKWRPGYLQQSVNTLIYSMKHLILLNSSSGCFALSGI